MLSIIAYDHCHVYWYVSVELVSTVSYLHIVMATQPSLQFANSFGANDPDWRHPIHTRAVAVISFLKMDLTAAKMC